MNVEERSAIRVSKARLALVVRDVVGHPAEYTRSRTEGTKYRPQTRFRPRPVPLTVHGRLHVLACSLTQVSSIRCESARHDAALRH